MNFEITQSLQRKLERRIERLRTIDGRFLSSAMKQFFYFLETEPILQGILNKKEIEISLSENTKKFYGWEDLSKIEDENELIKMLIVELKNLADKNYGLDTGRIAENFGCHATDPNKLREFIFATIIQPFCDYFIEQLDNQSAILGFILRYKHRSEWFHSDKLRKIADDELERKQSGEKKRAVIEDCLATDFYAYLYDEGLDFHIEPSSITGKIDLIEGGKRPLLEGQKNSSHRLLADAKVFDSDNRDAGYIGKGFGQILRYCKKYDEPFGYLIIYNISEGELEFDLPNTINGIPIYEHYGKTIVFIVIDINKSKADSTVGKAKTYIVKEKHLSDSVMTD